MVPVVKALLLPMCRFCGRNWHPQEGVVAAKSFCGACSKERREVAIESLGTKPIVRFSEMGAYTLPRKQRAG